MCALVCCCLFSSLRAQETISEAQAKFFEAKIRPVLVERCYSCHSEDAKEIHGGLLLDTRAGMRRGGDSGPAVVPGNLAGSLLITAIRYGDDDFAMPPDVAGGKLAASVIQDFETWVKTGAADPRDGKARVVAKYDTAKARAWWAFQPIRRESAPKPRDRAWATAEIDRFIEAVWQEKGLTAVDDAEPLALLRRLRFDLTGLPPSSEEAAAFIAEWNKSASRQTLLESTVDRLLRSPQFGERWGRHWLDVARYAESSGKDVNVVFPHAWRYRDYVIDALNDDKPFDDFIREQMAGDLLPARSDKDRAENLIATGFRAVGTKSLNETNPKQFAVDLADEQIDAVTQSFLGLTVACARCHDHRFDPVSQRDYTALAGIFLSTDTRFGTAGGVQGRNQSTLVELPAKAKLATVAKAMPQRDLQQKTARLESLQQQQRNALAQRANGRSATDGMSNFDVVRIITQATQLESELSVVNEDGSPKPLAMAAVDRPVEAPVQRGRRGPRGQGRRPANEFETILNSPFFARGNIDNEGDRVPRGVPTLLAVGNVPSTREIVNEPQPGTSGRRELAEAIVSRDNPLAARVIVNRVWHWLLGRGLVESVDNFGTTGSEPSHPELLDYLADRFQRDDWSLKKLIRSIVLSRTYRLSSQFAEGRFAIDPDNACCWRHSPRRLEAEEIGDAILFAAGELNLRPPAGSLVGRAGDGPIGGDRMMALKDEQIANAQHKYRSIYLPIARNVQPVLLATFDLPDASAPDGHRETTNVPSQSLFLLNSDFTATHSRTLAELLLKQYPGAGAMARFEDRLQLAYARVLIREPGAVDRAAAKTLMARHQNDPVTGWTSLVRALFASAQFRLLE